jgi:predicted phosphodiesterase
VLAVLYDIHGNLPALEAVLTDAQARGADRYLLGGDYASLGAWPVETLERLRKLPTVARLRGNWERWQANPEDMPEIPFNQAACRWVREQIGAAAGELGALPETTTVDGTFFCHASPRSDMRSFFPEPADDEAELLAGVSEKRLVFGHTHLQFQRLSAGGIELVNPGSVGLPFDGDTRAAYAVIDGERLELRRVEYDYERAAALARERIAEVGDDIAERIESASPP